MSYTVNEMIERLEELVEAGHGDKELRFAHQQHYPLQEMVLGVVDPVEHVSDQLDELIGGLDAEEIEEMGIDIESPTAGKQVKKYMLDHPAEFDLEGPNVVYVVAGGQPRNIPYASSDLWNYAR